MKLAIATDLLTTLYDAFWSVALLSIDLSTCIDTHLSVGRVALEGPNNIHTQHEKGGFKSLA